MNVTEVIKGTIESVIFKNDDTGYAVCRLKPTGAKDSIVCVGNLSDVICGETLELDGYYDEHGKYGKQFKVDDYSKVMPDSTEGVVKYLGSGIIPGIGERLAQRIVDKFGEDTFNIIETDYLSLSKVKGISAIKAKEISLIFAKQKEMREAIVYLSNYGITTNLAIKIYEKYKENTVKAVQNNPYALISDIRGIGFKQSDDIARKMGIAIDSPNRVSAAIVYSLSEASMNGHVYLPVENLVSEVRNLIGTNETLIYDIIEKLQSKQEVYRETVNGEDAVYIDWLYKAENTVAYKIKELNTQEKKIDEKKLEKRISELEKEKNIKLAQKQKDAIKEIMKNKVSIITGGPGTGKTTLIKFVIDILDEEKKVIMLAAPTGRAAKRMTETTGKEAQTIHRLLEVKVIDEEREYQKFEKDETNPLEADAIIIDEVSMLDIQIASSLLKAIMAGSKVIFVGDHNQLPSVGPGNFLKDLILSEKAAVVELTEIFRQSQDSHISIYARDVNNGVYPDVSQKSSDFFFVKRNTNEGVLTTMKELIETRLPRHVDCEPKDIQILSPMRKGVLGVENLNAVFQEIVNPKTNGKNEKELSKRKFRIGDKVMQIKNDYKLAWEKFYSATNIIESQGVFNGEQGEITNIKEDGSLDVMFDDEKIAEYSGITLDELELSYAITIHKSQGSEYPVVVIPLLSGPDMLFTRNLLYTAITRAKKMLVIVGSAETMNRMIDNNKQEDRYSGLRDRLI